MKYLALVCLIGLVSCGGSSDKGELEYYRVSQTAMEAFVNDKAMPTNPNFNADKVIINRDYPIEIGLYKNGKFFYDLPNLGTGNGTYKYENGILKLFAERSLFDMYIDIVAADENADRVTLRFSDRFGPRILTTEKINFE